MNRSILTTLLSILVAASASAAWLENVPQTLVQPNGDTVHCFATGDEFYHWFHDKDDYTITRDPATGNIVYATVIADKMGASRHLVGEVDPVGEGLQEGIRISNDEYQLRRAEWPDYAEMSEAPHTGTINHIVIFVRFSDETNFVRPASAFLDQFNSDTAGDISVFNYFLEASYEQLGVISKLCPNPFDDVQLSFKDTLPRGYYQEYHAVTNPIGYDPDDGDDRTIREHKLLRAAVAYADSYIPAGLELDGDNDNIIDNITFIIRGGPDDWGNLLWPHRWTLHSYNVQLKGSRIWDYAFMFESDFGEGIGTMCHEMFHVLGAPDLYHYDSTYGHLWPGYLWALMDNQGNPPHHMLAHMKEKYGWWTTIPTMTVAGNGLLHPLTESYNHAYRLYPANSTGEHFVVEYRQRTGPFEISIPDSGLLVYRVNPSLHGNAGGPPDEVYIYRPGGTLNVNGEPWNAEFCADEGRVCINNLSDPRAFLSNDDGGMLFLADIGYVGETISFFYSPTYELIASATSGVLDPGASTPPSINWMIGYTYAPPGQTLTFANGSRTYVQRGKKLTGHGEIIVEQGNSWTRLQTVDRYKTGIRTRGGIRMVNGGSIRFH